MFPDDPRRRLTNFFVSKPKEESYRDVCCGVSEGVAAEAGGGLVCKRCATGVRENSCVGDDEMVEGVAAVTGGGVEAILFKGAFVNGFEIGG